MGVFAVATDEPEVGGLAQPVPGAIWTIGHANRSLQEFIDLLRGQHITLLVDIRRFLGSRRSPQFSPEALAEALALAGIGYLHLVALGGRRRPRPDSLNIAWRNDSFRGYADYMETAEFAMGLRELVAEARTQRVAIMCAETLWWRCHRAMVSDALVARGWQVWHILDAGPPKPHRLSEPARIVDGRLTYHPASPVPPLSP